MPPGLAADESLVTLHRTSTPPRGRGRALTLLLGVLAAALLLVPAGASAVVVEAEPGGVKAGVQPHSIYLMLGATRKRGEPLYPENPAYPETFANPKGAPVVSSSHVYAIYWDPTDSYHGDWQSVIDTFFHNVSVESGSGAGVFSVDSQYTDRAGQHASYNTTFSGAVTDTEPYPAATCVDPQPLTGTVFPSHEPNQIACLTDKQVRRQLQTFIAQHHLPTGMGTIFYVLTPPGVTVCLNETGGAAGRCSDYEDASPESYEDSFCSYHSFINPDSAPEGDASTVLYSVIPWSAGNEADGHLFETLMPPGYLCQDGGYDPSSKPVAELREHVKGSLEEEEEKRKEAEEKKRAAAEEEEAKKQTTYEESYKKGLISEEELNEKVAALAVHREEREEKEKTEEKKAAKVEKEAWEKKEKLEGPHIQEPNQVPCPTSDGDGYCDEYLAEVIVNQIAAEQQNTVTDPLLDGWQDTVGNEAADECRNYFASGAIHGSSATVEDTEAGTLSNEVLNGVNYYLNNAFNLAGLKLAYPGVPCLEGIDLVPKFTVPNPVKSEEIVGFDGMESQISLDEGTAYNAKGEPTPTYATYTWNFGDGSPTVTGYAPGQAPGNPPAALCEEPWLAPCAASTFHSYKYGGTYEVTLTVTDVGGNTATTSQTINVVGPPPPAPPVPAPPSSPSNGTSGTPGASGGSGGSAGSTALPQPVATAAAVSSSLKQVARKGLVVRYSVNEQVTGHFEVLLESGVAHHLGISGPSAANLPAGFPKSVVIGRALLVTLKGGRSSVRIKFAKSTAKHLRRAHKVTLTLRLVVRNASSQSPLFTTVMSTSVLH
jgi:hypothetical protein